MVRHLLVPEDVRAALNLHSYVEEAWTLASDDQKEAWLNFIDEATDPPHRERRIDILISSLRR